MLRRLFSITSALCLAGCAHRSASAPPDAPLPAAPPDALAEHTARMWAWFPGEYGNHEQVLEQEYNDLEPYERLHQIFMPVDIPALGDRVLFVQQHIVGNPAPYRVRIYTLRPDPDRNAVRLDIYKPTDPAALTGLHLDPDRASAIDPTTALSLAEGCSVWWTPSDEGYVGQTDADTCRVQSPKTGQTMVFSDTLLLTPERLHIQDVARTPEGALLFGHPDGDPHKLRKLSWYSGWSVVRKGGPDYDREAPEWQVHKGLHMHSEGTRIPLMDAEGESIPYAVELARLTRSGSNTHLLKLTLYETETDTSVAYTWTDPTAHRIGMNLGWAQVGLTREPGTPHYGFDSEERAPLVRELTQHLVGTLSSAEQASRDPDYRSIRLQTCPVHAPGLGSTVLYVEQAVAETPDQPYRQRLYALEAIDDITVRSTIYTLDEPEPFIGLCDRRERPFIHPSKAGLRAGCEVDMTGKDGAFHGQTQPKSCPSSRQGATHATVSVTVSAAGLDSWDQGWNADDQQVWGAEKGPYEFRRVAPEAPTAE